MPQNIERIRRLIRARLFEVEEVAVSTDTWMVPFGNLMTILMIFFMVLYAFAQINKEKSEKALDVIQIDVVSREEQERKYRRLEQIKKMEYFIFNNMMAEYISMDMVAQKMLFTLKEPILFESGKAVLKETAWPALHEIALFMNTIPGKINIEGHTDSLPLKSKEFAGNWELGAERAHEIMEYFVAKERIGAERFILFSYGPYSPVANNDTDENRAKNRRIEISIDEQS